jgi:hypothetical protein
VSVHFRAFRSVVWVALCAFLSSTALPLYESHALDADDAACLAAGAGKAPQTITTRTTDDRQPTHCAVCHLLRAVSGTVTPSIAAFVIPAASSSAIGRVDGALIAVEESLSSSRAPPSHT